MTGLIVLAVALAATAAVAVLMRRTNGRFAAASARDDRPRLTAGQIGAALGESATLVQFSTEFCSPCRATRVLLTDIAATEPGVVTVEIAAEEHLDLVRELDVRRTPTVLVLDASGAVVTRSSGLPRREQVLAALHETSSGR